MMTSAEKTKRMVTRLSQELSGTRVQGAAPTRLERNRDHNLLAAVMLNAFARQSKQKPLTDLEQALIKGFQTLGYSNEDLSALGVVFTQASVDARSRIFPERYARLNEETGYSLADLRAELPRLAQEVPNMKNLHVLDSRHVSSAGFSLSDIQRKRTELGLGEDVKFAEPPPVSESFRQAQRELGWSITCVGVKPERAAAVRGATLERCKLSAVQVKCYEGTHEWGNDEPFYGFAVSDGETGTKYVTEELSMDEGDMCLFQPNKLWDTAVPGGGLAITIDAWEADHSNQYDKEIEVLTEILKILLDELFIDNWMEMGQTIIDQITGAGVPAEAIALMALIVGGVIAILKNEDDYIGTYTALIPNAALLDWKEYVGPLQGKLPDEAIRILAERDYGGDLLSAGLIYTLLMLSGLGLVVGVPMDAVSENHGYYEVFFNAWV